jgi:hypothetical protein
MATTLGSGGQRLEPLREIKSSDAPYKGIPPQIYSQTAAPAVKNRAFYTDGGDITLSRVFVYSRKRAMKKILEQQYDRASPAVGVNLQPRNENVFSAALVPSTTGRDGTRALITCDRNG